MRLETGTINRAVYQSAVLHDPTLPAAPLADDIWKCALKPIDWKDYKVAFTDAEKAGLQKVFPGGVCDWSKPGLGVVPLKGTWLRY